MFRQITRNLFAGSSAFSRKSSLHSQSLTSPDYSLLESRNLRAADISYDPASDVVTIRGTDKADDVVIWSNSSNKTVTISASDGISQKSKTYSSPILRIDFLGNNGNDWLRNFSNIQLKANGGNGNDVLDGGSGRNSLYGDAGNDRLYGHENVDLLSGGDGDDYLKGGSGDDKLEGGKGNDLLEGQNGRDVLSVTAVEIISTAAPRMIPCLAAKMKITFRAVMETTS